MEPPLLQNDTSARDPKPDLRVGASLDAASAEKYPIDPNRTAASHDQAPVLTLLPKHERQDDSSVRVAADQQEPRAFSFSTPTNPRVIPRDSPRPEDQSPSDSCTGSAKATDHFQADRHQLEESSESEDSHQNHSLSPAVDADSEIDSNSSSVTGSEASLPDDDRFENPESSQSDVQPRPQGSGPSAQGQRALSVDSGTTVKTASTTQSQLQAVAVRLTQSQSVVVTSSERHAQRSSESHLSHILDSLLDDMAVLKGKMRDQEQSMLNSVDASDAHGIAIRFRKGSFSLSPQPGSESASQCSPEKSVDQAPQVEAKSGGGSSRTSELSSALQDLGEIKLDLGDFGDLHSTLAPNAPIIARHSGENPNSGESCTGADHHTSAKDSQQGAFISSPISPPRSRKLPAHASDMTVPAIYANVSTENSASCQKAEEKNDSVEIQLPPTNFDWQNYTHGRISFAERHDLASEMPADVMQAENIEPIEESPKTSPRASKSTGLKSRFRSRSRAPSRTKSKVGNGQLEQSMSAHQGERRNSVSLQSTDSVKQACGPFKKCTIL